MIKTICVNGVTLAYKEFGTGDNYLLSTQNFFLSDCHMELLGKPPYDYHTFLIYTRGFAGSEHIFDPQPRDYSAVWGRDVIAFAEALGIDRFYYTGVSHGNAAGWYIAFHRPELLRGFVCCDGIPRYQAPNAAPRGSKRPEGDLDAMLGNREALDKIAWMEPWPTQNPARLARRARNHEEHLQILLERRREEFLLPNSNIACCYEQTEAGFYAALGKLAFPVMILNGMLDPLATMAESLKIAKAIPGCVLLAYQQLGHGGMDECPEQAARDCDRFFRDTQGRVL